MQVETGAGATVLENVELFQAAGGTSHYRCRRCGKVLGPADQNFKAYAAKRVRPYAEMVALGLLVADSDRFVIKEFFCPDCGVMFDVESTAPDEEYLDIRLAEQVTTGAAEVAGKAG